VVPQIARKRIREVTTESPAAVERTGWWRGRLKEVANRRQRSFFIRVTGHNIPGALHFLLLQLKAEQSSGIFPTSSTGFPDGFARLFDAARNVGGYCSERLKSVRSSGHKSVGST
jgi:hypothetical protein